MRAVPKQGMRKRSGIIEILIDIFRGMNTIIHKAKIPIYLFTKLINWELSQQLNSIRKRTGYATLLSPDPPPNILSLYEFLNSNGDRLLVIQDGTSIKESVYSSGYGAVGAISNDKRYGTPNVTQMYPVEENNILRSGAGIGNAADLPFWYGYIAETKRFAENTTVAAGKYLTDQYEEISVVEEQAWDIQQATSYVSAVGLDMGNYCIILAPVYIDGQRGFPFAPGKIIPITVANRIIEYYITILDANLSKAVRIKAFDVFVVSMGDSQDIERVFDFPAYFLERVDLNDPGGEILTIEATFQSANPPTYIDSDELLNVWATMQYQTYFNCDIIGDTNTYLNVPITSLVDNGGYGRFTLNQTFVNGDNGDSCTIKIYPVWYDNTTSWIRACVYDNFYRILGSEMFTYLNIPQGDLGITDFRYKFSCICNNRYLIFGTPSGYGYFSKENNFDVIPSLNLLKPLKNETGCFSINYDVFVGYKDTFSRFTVLSNENADKDHRVFDFGLTSQKGWDKIDEGNIAVNSYKGPYIVTGRSSAYIGSSIQTWFKKTGDKPYLTQAQLATGTVSYNHLADKVIFSYPDYTSADFTNGISFVFDFVAHKAGFEAWYIMRSDKKLKSTCLADDLHLLSSGGTEVQDWNNASPTESFGTEIGFKLLRQSKKRHSINWKKIYIQADSDDTFTAKLYFDGSASSTDITISSTTLEGIINYIKTTLEVVITTPASTNSGEISEITITNVPRMR